MFGYFQNIILPSRLISKIKISVILSVAFYEPKT